MQNMAECVDGFRVMQLGELFKGKVDRMLCLSVASLESILRLLYTAHLKQVCSTEMGLKQKTAQLTISCQTRGLLGC